MRVWCVGLATVDLVYRVARIPGLDEKAQADSAEVAAGGPATNAAVTAAALGADVTLVTAVGAHPLSHLIREDLSRHGVTMRDATPAAPQPPTVSAVTVLAGTGERTIVSRNAADVRAGVPPGLLDGVEAADVVLVDGHHPALAAACVEVARRAGVPVVVDAGSWRPVFARLLPMADVVACSAAFRHPQAAGDATTADDTATASALRAAGVPHVAITHGQAPVRWWSGDRAGSVPVPPVGAADTAGAGDVFHGALAVAVARDPRIVDLAGALRYALRIAAIRVTHAGPRAWLADPRLPS